MVIKLVATSLLGNSVAYIHDEGNCTAIDCEMCKLPKQELSNIVPVWNGVERRDVLRDDSIYEVLPAALEGIVWKRG
jgi:hypothetical protein